LKTLSIVLPCYNEEGNIPLLLKNFELVIKRDDIEVILVDNGSTDKSEQILKDLIPKYNFAKTIRVNINKGYGHGIRCGLKVAQGKYLAWTHSDMQTHPKDVIQALNLIEKNYDDSVKVFVKGLRKGRAIKDKIFTVGMSIFESIYLWTPLWDINAQPNLFHRSLFDNWYDCPNDFSFDLFYYYIAIKNGYKIVRFNVNFDKRFYGTSSWNINLKSKFRFIIRTILFTIKFRNRIKTDEKLRNLLISKNKF
tara:strand:+ start:26 stop:778 length:753 start_codon:yes stop_codon:yes gene_type:complete